jgi:hypothetical protein
MYEFVQAIVKLFYINTGILLICVSAIQPQDTEWPRIVDWSAL